MAFQGFSGPALTGVGNPATVYDSAIVPVGTVATDTAANEYIFLPGVASVVAGDGVTYNPSTYATTRIAGNAIGPVAFFRAAVVANKYGWAQIKGVVPGVNCDSGVVLSSALYIDGTTGRVDDTKVVGDLILGAFAASTDTSNKCDVLLTERPYVTDVLPAA
jgi:hypothetical protein